MTVRGRLVREEQGFTLPEMLVTMLLMVVILFALYSVFDASIRVFSFGNDKVEAVENARVGLERIEREVRAAYPVDLISQSPDRREHVFFDAGAPRVAALPVAVVGLAANQKRSLTFANDLPQGGSAPNRRISDPAGNVDPREIVTYRLNTGCPTAGTGGVCTIERVTYDASGAQQPSVVVGSVIPNGLTFTLLRGDLSNATAVDGTDVGVVRVALTVSVDGRTQTLTTDVDLRNRGG